MNTNCLMPLWTQCTDEQICWHCGSRGCTSQIDTWLHKLAFPPSRRPALLMAFVMWSRSDGHSVETPDTQQSLEATYLLA